MHLTYTEDVHDHLTQSLPTKFTSKLIPQMIVSVSSVIFCNKVGPRGFWGSRENDYLFSGNWGASSYFWGFREPCKKVKKSHLKGKAFILFNFFQKISSASGGSPPDPPLDISMYLLSCKYANLDWHWWLIWQIMFSIVEKKPWNCWF